MWILTFLLAAAAAFVWGKYAAATDVHPVIALAGLIVLGIIGGSTPARPKAGEPEEYADRHTEQRSIRSPPPGAPPRG